MKKILSIIAIFVVILSLLASNSVFAKPGDSSSQEIPKFNPSIDEMQKDPDFYKPFVPSDPIPESEMTHIFFSESWLIKNDFDNDPNTIRITFPVL